MCVYVLHMWACPHENTFHQARIHMLEGDRGANKTDKVSALWSARSGQRRPSLNNLCGKVEGEEDSKERESQEGG